MMQYSAVIPCYNGAITIGRAIQSVLAQAIAPQAIIIIDDASTDDTAAVVGSIESDLIVYHRFEYNRGVSAARNHGWSLAKGTFVAFLDADDEWHPDKMVIISKYAKAMSAPVMAHAFSYHELPYFDLLSPINYYLIKMVRFRSMLLSNKIVSGSVIVQRDFPERYDERMRYCEDHDFLLRCSYYLPIAYLDIPLAKVNRQINTKGGLSGNLWKMRKGELYMYLKLYKIKMPLILLKIPLLFYSMMKHLRLITLKWYNR